MRKFVAHKKSIATIFFAVDDVVVVKNI